MEPIFCPNGHPNRPGTRLCVVCLALIASPAPSSAPARSGATPDQAATATSAPQVSVAAPSPPTEPDVTPELPAAPRPKRRRGCWVALVLLLLLLGLALVASIAFFVPIRERAEYLATAIVVTVPDEQATAAGEALVPSPTTALAAAEPATPPPPATPTPLPVASQAPDTGTPTPVATITPLATIIGVVLTPTASLAPLQTTIPGLNLIQNGDFRDDWVNGWERDGDELNGAQMVEVRKLAGAPPLDALYVSKSGAGALRVLQHVMLTGPAADLVFRARVRLAGMVQGAAEGRAALILVYEDADGQPLGASVWLDGSAATRSSGGDLLAALGPATVPRFLDSVWQEVSLDLRREFNDYLPDLNPEDVRRITVQLAVWGSDHCAPDACSAELGAAALSLSAGAAEP